MSGLAPPRQEPDPRRIDAIVAAARRLARERESLPAEVAGARAEGAVAEASFLEPPCLEPLHLTRASSSPAAFAEAAVSRHVHDFDGLDEREFLVSAHRVVLGREGDADSLRRLAEEIATGRRTRLDVLWALRKSEEGRRHGAQIRGLRLRYQAHRLSRAVPWLAWWVLVPFEILRLPARERARRLEIQRLQRRIVELEAAVDQNAAALEAACQALGDAVHELRAGSRAPHAATLLEVARRLAALESRAARPASGEAETLDHR